MILYKVYRVCVLLSIYNLMPNVKSTSSIHSEQKLRFLRYIVFYCELGCDTSEPHVSCISRACSSLVRQPYYAPNSFILKISGLETIFVTKKGSLNGRTFYIDEYTLIFLFSQCIRCAQKRDCWESVRFASERSRVRLPSSPYSRKPLCRSYTAGRFSCSQFYETVRTVPMDLEPVQRWKITALQTLKVLEIKVSCGQMP